jgi:hypothetical protein
MALAALGERAEALDPYESPDCLATLGQGQVGIEVTALRASEELGGVNVRHVVASQFAVVERAVQRYRERQGPPVAVSFRFRDGVRIAKSELTRVADELAEDVLAITQVTGRRSPTDQYRGYTLTHPLIVSADIMRVPLVTIMKWRPRMAGIVRRATLADFELTLSDKELRLNHYRAAVQTIWLLVVADVMAPGLFVNPPADPVDFVVRTGFDRVICASWNGEHAVDLPIRGAERSAAEVMG